MPYELSFSEDFFSGDGECDVYSVPPSDRPTSVLQAIVSLPRELQVEIAREVMGANDPELYVESESFAFDVLERVRETNTCGDLSSPVDVWIDSEGWYTVEVHDDV